MLSATALMARDPGLRSSVTSQLEKGRPTAHSLDCGGRGVLRRAGRGRRVHGRAGGRPARRPEPGAGDPARRADAWGAASGTSVCAGRSGPLAGRHSDPRPGRGTGDHHRAGWADQSHRDPRQGAGTARRRPAQRGDGAARGHDGDRRRIVGRGRRRPRRRHAGRRRGAHRGPATADSQRRGPGGDGGRRRGAAAGEHRHGRGRATRRRASTARASGCSAPRGSTSAARTRPPWPTRRPPTGRCSPRSRPQDRRADPGRRSGQAVGLRRHGRGGEPGARGARLPGLPARAGTARDPARGAGQGRGRQQRDSVGDGTDGVHPHGGTLVRGLGALARTVRGRGDGRGAGGGAAGSTSCSPRSTSSAWAPTTWPSTPSPPTVCRASLRTCSTRGSRRCST